MLHKDIGELNVYVTVFSRKGFTRKGARNINAHLLTTFLNSQRKQKLSTFRQSRRQIVVLIFLVRLLRSINYDARLLGTSQLLASL
jgi:hypothetical protein